MGKCTVSSAVPLKLAQHFGLILGKAIGAFMPEVGQFSIINHATFRFKLSLPLITGLRRGKMYSDFYLFSELRMKYLQELFVLAYFVSREF